MPLRKVTVDIEVFCSCQLKKVWSKDIVLMQ